jgi:hypothetical protein
MSDRPRPPRGGTDWRERVRVAFGGTPRKPDRLAARPAPRGTYSPRERHPHRHPVYGSQARRDNQYAPYVVGFILIIAALGGFLYVGLNWATGPGRLAALANPPTPTPVVVPTQAPVPTPTVGEVTYVVKPGDNPATIAQQFRVKTEDLLALNSIEDPRSLQIGQTLKIPPVAGR